MQLDVASDTPTDYQSFLKLMCDIVELRGISFKFWSNLRQFGAIWGNLGQFGAIWGNLKQFNFIQFEAILGNFGQFWAISCNFFLRKVGIKYFVRKF